MMQLAKSLLNRWMPLTAALFLSSPINAVLADDTIDHLKIIRQGSTLHITASAESPGVWTNTQVLIDADGNAKTGYQGAGASHGFDTMVEGATVYHFKGSDPTAWAWDKVGTADRKGTGGEYSLDVDVSLLGGRSSTASVLLRTLSPDYQKVIFTSEMTTVDLGKSAEPAKQSASKLNAKFTQNGPDLVVKVTTQKPADIDTLLIFFDTDCDSSTGFLPPADPHFGFEEMIQGESLSAHTGDSRGGWNWKTLGPVKRTVDGSSVEFSFDASLLKSNKIRATIWQMSPDWQTRTDQYPGGDTGTTELSLDVSKLHAQVVRPPMPFADARANKDLPPRERFQKITSYYCYYGAGQTSDLSHFDAVILHTPAQTATEVGKLKDLGVVTIGYLSVGEDEQLHVGDGKGPGGKASWYFDRNGSGQPEKNGTWNSWYANAADPQWRANRVAEAKRLCESANDGIGFDGLFLDTIETCDAYPQSRAGMIQLVGELRAALPDKVIVINRGFSLLKEPDVSSRIDGLMFESFSDSYDFDAKKYIEFAPQDLDATRQVMVDAVLPATRQYPLRVLALDYCRPDQTDRIQKAFDRAVTFGMVPSIAPIFLDEVYDTTKVTGKPDSRYLSKQATPESLSITLDSPRNGFPAGTRIEPSSCFLGYSVAAIVDGIRDRQSLHWSKAAWASAEEPGVSQQLDFSFPTSITGGAIHVTFAFDNNKWEVSRKIQIQVRSDDHSEWVNLPISTDAHACDAALPATAIHRLRIVQDPAGGSVDRPDLMWIAQVERTQ
jgi:hypothetical protein